MDMVRLTIQRMNEGDTEPEEVIFNQLIDLGEAYLLLLAMFTSGLAEPAHCLMLNTEKDIIKLQHRRLLEVPVTAQQPPAEAPQPYVYTFSSAGSGMTRATFAKLFGAVAMVARQRPDLCSQQFRDAMHRQLTMVD